MPAPNLGLVGARGNEALYGELQKMVAERQFAQKIEEERAQAEFNRARDTREAEELSRHRQALEEYQKGDLTVRQAEAAARAAAANQRPKPIVHSGLAGTDPADKRKYTVGISPDTGERLWQQLEAETVAKPENLTPLESYLAQRNQEQIDKGGKPFTSEQVKAATREYNLGTTREPRDFAPYVIATQDGIQVVDRKNLTAAPVTGAGGQPLQPQDTAEVRNRQATADAANVVIDSISELSQRINTGRGVAARIQGPVERAKAEANLNDDVSEYQGLIAMNAPLIARAMGRVGVMTEQDEARVLAGLPRPEDSKTVAARKVARLKKIMDAIATGRNDDSEAAGGAPGGGTGGGRTDTRTAAPYAGEKRLAKDGKTWLGKDQNGRVVELTRNPDGTYTIK